MEEETLEKSSKVLGENVDDHRKINTNYVYFAEKKISVKER